MLAPAETCTDSLRTRLYESLVALRARLFDYEQGSLVNVVVSNPDHAQCPSPSGIVSPGRQFGTAASSVGGTAGVPATGVSAVTVNLTVTRPTASSYLTVYPGGPSLPSTSSLNFLAG
jgi:hypothetical protein